MAKIFNTYIVQKVIQGGGDSGITDNVFFELIFPDAANTPTDDATFDLDINYADTANEPTDAVNFGIEGLFDTANEQTTAQQSELIRWSTQQTTAGTAPTNPNNALGENNGTLANVKAGGLANGTSTLTLTIVAPFSLIETNPTLRAYYRTNAGVLDTFVKRVTYNGSTTIDMPDGDFLTTPYEVVLPNVDTNQNITITYSHSVAVILTGGSIDVDATGISSTGIL